jgi:hypothetical protein
MISHPETIRWDVMLSADYRTQEPWPWVQESGTGIADCLLLLADRGARQIQHAVGSFLDHLLGTYELLVRWGYSDERCRAGLAHSAYGSDENDKPLFSIAERSEIVGALGAPAERLALLFATVDRPHMLACLERDDGLLLERIQVRNWRSGEQRELDREHVADLLAVELANLLEQSHGGAGRPGLWMARGLRMAEWISQVDGRIAPCFAEGAPSEADEAQARDLYLQAVDAIEQPIAADLLAQVCHLNPHPAEPWIVRARLSRRSSGAQAAEFAKRGLALLERWGTPWDKRASLSSWTHLALSLR